MGDFPITEHELICPVCRMPTGKHSDKQLGACQWVMVSVLFQDFLMRNSKGGGVSTDDNEKPPDWGV